MTNREKDLVSLIKTNPFISQQEISQKLGIQRSSVAVQISNLMKKGHILGKGYILGEKQNVVVIGGSNIDLSGIPQNQLIMRDSNIGSIHLSVGGVGRNIADNLARLDIPVSLITAISKDIHGKKILEECNQVGIDMTHAITSEKEACAMYLSIQDHKGDMMLALVDSKIHEEISPMQLQKKKHVISSAEVVVIDTNLTEQAIHYITENFKDQKIFADTVSSTKAQKLKNVLPSLYAIKPNKHEAEILTGIQITNQTTLNQAMDKLLNKGVQNIYISMGEKGVYYGNQNTRGYVEAKSCNIINATGAGDAMMAGLIYGHLKGYKTEQTIAYSQAMASITLSSNQTISTKINPLTIKQKMEEN